MAKTKIFRIQNKLASLEISAAGGSITNFHLRKNKINPLSFAFTKEQMPENNKQGAPYKGHFVCFPYWGPVSAGEYKMSMPNHGPFCNTTWGVKKKDLHHILMQAKDEQSGFEMKRNISLNKDKTVIKVEELFKNLNSLAKPYNIVQHPSLAAPFLGKDVIIDCNGDTGFNQEYFPDIMKSKSQWPNGFIGKDKTINLRKSDKLYNGVFSFTIKKKDKYGWVTAYSPSHKLLIGYVWEAVQYPWINIWKHYENDKIKYTGIEFGTTGIHQPMVSFTSSHASVFNANTFCFMDAGDTCIKRYWCFLLSIDKNTKGIKHVDVDDKNQSITVATKEKERYYC